MYTLLHTYNLAIIESGAHYLMFLKLHYMKEISERESKCENHSTTNEV